MVPRGVEHCPKANDEAHVFLIEPKIRDRADDLGAAAQSKEERREDR